MSKRLAVYKNKTTIDHEMVAAMEVISSGSVKVIFKSGAVVTMEGYQGLATNYQDYMKSKYDDKN